MNYFYKFCSQFVFLIIILSSCSGDIDYNYPEDPVIQRKERAGKFFGDEVVVYGNKSGDSTQIISNKLFLNAHKTLLELVEIDIIDPDAGILSGKWKINKDKNQKTKITLIINGAEVREENIKISISKKYLDKEGKWQNKISENEEMLKSLLKAKIINYDRKL